MQIKLKDIVESITKKNLYSVENVYVNGRRVGGETEASSEKQAVANIVFRNLEGSHKNYPTPHFMKAFQLKGFKVKKINRPQQVTDKKYWWQDTD